MSLKANKQAMCETLLALTQHDSSLRVLTSDSRNSASLNEYAKTYPEHLIEVGIAEQNIVGIAAGLGLSHLTPVVVSPACFLSMRSIEQIKVDVAYSNSPVTLIGISGGVSYGPLGMSHYSIQDIAVTRAIANLDVYLPCDPYETQAVIEHVIKTKRPAYIRLGRNAVEPCYLSDQTVEIGKATCLREGHDITFVATGEVVIEALKAQAKLATLGVSAEVLAVHSLKPFDDLGVQTSALKTKRVISVEEHSVYGGLGSAVLASLSELDTSIKCKVLGFPDENLKIGSQKEIIDYYGLGEEHLVKVALAMVTGHDQ